TTSRRWWRCARSPAATSTRKCWPRSSARSASVPSAKPWNGPRRKSRTTTSPRAATISDRRPDEVLQHSDSRRCPEEPNPVTEATVRERADATAGLAVHWQALDQKLADYLSPEARSKVE